MEFVKFHGYGNDYIVCEAKQLAGVADVSDFVRRICDRHYGAGADGVATLEGAADERGGFCAAHFQPGRQRGRRCRATARARQLHFSIFKIYGRAKSCA
jgi:diaminopimelate epimerase